MTKPKQAVKTDGCKKEPFDPKDFDAKLLMGEEEEFPKKYSVFQDLDLSRLRFNSVEELIRKIIEDQGTSSACVAEATAYVAEALNIFDFGRYINLSPRSIYQAIHLPGGGAYLRRGAKHLVNKGVSEENLAPSYPATEEQLRKEISEQAQENALTYQSKDFAKYFQKDDMDFYARMIHQNQGFLSGVELSSEGWQDARVRPPKDGEDTGGHALYFYKYDLTKTPKEVWALGSWGLDYGMDDKPGRHILTPDYLLSDYMFDVRTFVDKQNKMDTLDSKLNKEAIKELYKAIHRREPNEDALDYWEGAKLQDFLQKVRGSEEFGKYDRLFDAGKEIENWARSN